MKAIIKNLKHLVDETGILTKAASEGMLKTRGKKISLRVATVT